MPRAIPLLTRLGCATALHLALVSPALCESYPDPLERDFANPPDTARPWVWAHWLHGNVDKPSITRQLEAMKRVGLGGLTMFDVAQPGIPAGPNKYMDAKWRELFAWEVSEAKRLGLEVMSHVGPGYSGTGGPWIKPEFASQRIVESATRVPGGQGFSGILPQPPTSGGFYQDVAVLAVIEHDAQAQFKIEDFDMKRLVWLNYIRWKGVRSAPLDATAPEPACIPRGQIIDLTDKMRADGSIEWDAPPGKWTILRIGHTWTGQKTLPATPEGQGPECDKLDKRGIRTHFDHVMKRMVQLAGPAAGKTFHTFFVDSWEAGGQNWTENMPAEFKRRRGYDIIPFLPVLTGRVVADLQTSERFLYDLRQTVSELMNENFWGEMRRLCHANGMKLAVQPYITTGNDLDAADIPDEPAGEFWAIPNVPGNDYSQTVKLAASAANLNGRRIVGAEAFTSTADERWLSHPAKLKELGDRMFCLGANRFQFHRYAMQRFPQLKPGMMMGGWGQQYDSTQTWWEWSRPWHDYLARCQYLLRQGPVVTDVLALAAEEPLWRYEHQPVTGHDSDACGPANFARLVMAGGKPGMPDGPAYELITVAHHGTMTLARLRKLRDIVHDGARLLGEPPAATPGLGDAPGADAEFKALALELWGGQGESERSVGKGRVFRGIPPEEALRRLGVARDFEGPADMAWIHRRAGEVDIYFVATPAATASTHRCSFRVAGKTAELWDPETGRIRSLETHPSGDGRSSADVPLGPKGSAFVVFRPGRHGTTAVTKLQRIGEAETTHAIQGPWSVAFPAESGVREPLRLESLASWHTHPDPDVRHFSGTAVYQTSFTLDSVPGEAVLDLGRVEVMARVKLNGRDLGILWKPPYQADVAGHLRQGRNDLEISVVNLWVNRLIGDAGLPEDSADERDQNGRITKWPQWVLRGAQSPTGRRSFVTFPLWKAGDALRESGLLGPVVLKSARD